MFSYLRPHHKRSPSNPTSPADQSHSFEPPLHTNSPLDHGHPYRYHDADPSSSSSSLPPIVRVSSAESQVEDWRSKGKDGEPRKQHWDALRSSTRPAEINTYSNHHRVPSFEVINRPNTAGNVGRQNHAGSPYTRSQAGTSKDVGKAPGQQSVTPTDIQTMPVQSGRRATGVRLPTPPPSLPNQVSKFEPVQPKSGKARLNLLNPMSLLARRRTPQAVPQLLSESLVSKRGSDTYDFQIKGKFVHDFSAPRVKRNVPYESRLQENGNRQQYQRSPNLTVSELALEDAPVSPWSGGHTPVFTENFDEEQYPAAGPHVRKASDVTDLPLPTPPYARGPRKLFDPNSKPSPVPPSSQPGQEPNFINQIPVSDIGPEVPPKEDDNLQFESRRVSGQPGSSRQISTASSRKVPRNVSNASGRSVIPKHMKSVSSRFSFDMIGAAEQERLLEDRHRQKALEKQNGNSDEYDRDDEFGDDFDYENMMDDDGLEERIPGVNAELEEEDYQYDNGIYEEEIPGVNADLEDDVDDIMISNQDLGDFTFQQTFATPISFQSPGMVGTPRDVNGEVIGFAMTKESPFARPPQTDSDQAQAPAASNSHVEGLGIEQRIEGLGLQGVDMPELLVPQLQPLSDDEGGFPIVDGLDDDDLYFDDGIIGELDGEDGVEFDESVFDNIDTDQYGRPIRSLSSLPTLYSPPMLTADPSPSFKKIAETTIEVEGNITPPVLNVQPGNLAPKPSVSMHVNPLQSAQTLTQDSLAAYQSALAEAAYRADAEGKFRRESVSTLQMTSEEEPVNFPPGLIHDSSLVPNLEAFSSSYDLEDDFDYDDLMEDDAIIAAANAEALANDSDGFYGQEFGFYSAPSGEAEIVNGGYFGARGVEGINRSTSGRVASREPNLTPITERSEYSNRNSIMGLSMNRGDILSPGLAQLAGMLREGNLDSELSLGALMKLRRGAWGGSQASLRSSNGNASPRSAGLDDGSPVGGNPPWSAGTNQQPVYLKRSSGFSSASALSDNSTVSRTGKGRRNSTGMAMEIGPPHTPAASLPGSPTFNCSSSMLSADHAQISPNEVASPSSISSPMSRGGSNDGQLQSKDDSRSHFRKHRYTRSSESISYLKEEDAVDGERWILERRRMADSGEVELLAREVVSGGRI